MTEKEKIEDLENQNAELQQMYLEESYEKAKLVKELKGRKMKLFKVELDNIDWDTYDGCIVVAESEEAVVNLIKNNRYGFFVNEDQNMTIREIHPDDYKEASFLLASFRAG